MFKKISIIVSLLIFSFVSVYSLPKGKQELIQPDNFIYDALVALSTEQGIVLLTDQAPISIQEALFYLEQIDYEKLSSPGKAYYDKIYDYVNENTLSVSSGLFAAIVEPEFNIDLSYKTNEDVDWITPYSKKKAAIALPMGFQVGDYLTLLTDIDFQKNKDARRAHSNYINIPFALEEMDTNFPAYGYLSTGWSYSDNVHSNLQIGMGPQSFGRSINGSIILSEYLTGTSFLNFEIYSPKIKYDLNVTQFNVDKYMYSHRIAFNFFNKLEFQAMESMLVYAPLELRFLNPLSIYHGLAPWADYEPTYDYSESHICAYMCFSFAYTPIKGLRIYGNFAQDQLQTPYEINAFPTDCTPNAMGGQLGIESYIPYDEGYFHTWVEGYYAQPYLYIKEGPNWSLVRTYRETMGVNRAIFYEWVGSPFGPDTIAGEFHFGYIVPSKWEVNLSYLLSARGEMSGTNIFTDALHWGGNHTEDYNDDEWPYPNSYESDPIKASEEKRKQSLVTPTGTPEYVNRIAVYGSYSPRSWITINGQLGYTFIFNAGHVENVTTTGFEFTTSVSIKLPGGDGRAL